eukprot:CAMPEP_0201669152 /NCGR_PEP_ID=MMETSP0494-20130426/22522_1 /ASSEMBLY_ACC=CAM_ASM_000839 /TAXON_ID=420259 /ORGANISM="Thalassiosira gravida, Strain GMp14c1" /LENGTH=440 /DNA_ID=CAMNT_0048149821 /DNA_START=101 /DNA_END=1420 /DNA_ORIENTATION=-
MMSSSRIIIGAPCLLLLTALSPVRSFLSPARHREIRTIIHHDDNAIVNVIARTSHPTTSSSATSTTTTSTTTTSTTITTSSSSSSSLMMAGVDVSNLLYEEQEKLIVRRGQLEQTFVTRTRPLEPTVLKVRGTGKAGGFGKSSSGGGSRGKSSRGSTQAEGKAHAKVLRREGVMRIDNVLSEETADGVREYLYDLRRRSEREVGEGKLQPIQRFANVLLKRNRCDLTIPLGQDEIITKALEEALCNSPLGATISSIFGDGAILHEFSCLMSDPSSQRQVIHPDTPYVDGKGPSLYTCFIALQDVTSDMGPTVWLPRTHNKESHEAFKDATPSATTATTSTTTATAEEEGENDSPKDRLIKTKPAVLGLLSKGDCGIFDSRTLHCGSANGSDASRALFYFSFKDPAVGYAGNPASIRRELGGANVGLGDLMEDLTSFGRGK